MSNVCTACMKAAGEVLGASVPGGAKWLFKSIQQECVLVCVATHVCERTCPSQKCERDGLSERDFRQRADEEQQPTFIFQNSLLG